MIKQIGDKNTLVYVRSKFVEETSRLIACGSSILLQRSVKKIIVRVSFLFLVVEAYQ